MNTSELLEQGEGGALADRLTPAADSFYKRVTWEGDTAVAWRPHDDPLSPVLMRPGLRAGRPAVKGISTEILWEHEQSGETIAEVAEEYDLSGEDVRWAIAMKPRREPHEQRPRPALVRYHVDADLLGVAKVLVRAAGQSGAALLTVDH